MILTNNLNFKIQKRKKKYVDFFKQVLNSGILINGKFTKKFENNFKNYLKAKYCIACGNGTDALEIAFKSLRLSKTDTVYIAANSGMYSAISLRQLGINPHYYDLSDETYSPTIQIIKSLTKKPKAIVITHLYGKINLDIIKISQYCKKNKIFLIEDCAQAVGTSIKNQKVGTFGDVATFSFFPTKNLSGIGDGGAVVFKSKKNYELAKKLREYGWGRKYEVTVNNGQNSRIDEVNSAIINFNLHFLKKDNLSRYQIAKTYTSLIKNEKIYAPKILPLNFCNYHLFVIFVRKKRNKLIKFLKKNKIFTQIHYPIPDHKQKINLLKYKNLKLPITEKLSKQILTLPCYPELSISEVIRISKIINSWR
jgi:dTDP-3-amino-2,3,6-trideoxy-4-keto-D-glucose/dTDP-3-amino-3,4,6-trideoxy-alpha-D-glucose/dTDP-2,6-dideoxy-D-kanosamine transaminase